VTVADAVRPQIRWLLLARGVLGTIGSLCFMYALATMRLSDASALYFTNPIVTALLARVVRHVHCAALRRCLTLDILCVRPPHMLWRGVSSVVPLLCFVVQSCHCPIC
jgi:EamA domain-containing membrane protein RarD